MNFKTGSLRYIDYLLWLLKTRHVPGTGWVLQYRGIDVFLENLCDLITTREFLVGGYYEPLRDAAAPGSVLWDIGMNIGAVSVLFAQSPNFVHVYGYEPVEHTYDCALKSIALNPGLAGKITAANFGVGDRDYDIQIPYTAKLKSSIGVGYEISRYEKIIFRVKDSEMIPVTLRLKDAAEIYRGIRASYPSSDIVLKLDAEGAEHEIIDRLFKAGLLKDIQACSIEWHGEQGPDELLRQLHASGFETTTQLLRTWIGLIEARRTTNPKSTASPYCSETEAAQK